MGVVVGDGVSAGRDVQAYFEAQARALRQARHGDMETHQAIMEEWCVGPRTLPHWTDAMVWQCDRRDVERFCEALQRDWSKG